MLKNILDLARVHQYLKNFFIFAPLFFSGELVNENLLLPICLAFVAFSLTASSIYILNDFQDIEDDKKHETKKHRPLASGAISKKTALYFMGFFFVAGTSLAAFLSIEALAILGCYVILNIGYSFYFKHIALLDISIIAIGFCLRLFFGSAVVDVSFSMWLVIMTFLLSVFLALAKRRDDVLLFLKTGEKMRKIIDGYNLQLIDTLMAIMASVVIVAYILYTTSASIISQFNTEHLYLTSLFVILGILRYLQIAIVEMNSASPTKIVLKDKFMQGTILAWVLSFAWIIYL